MPPELRAGRDNDPPLRRPGISPAEGRPVDDLRAQPFTDDVFTDYHARRRESGGLSFGLIAGLVVGLAAVGGIGWYMYSTGVLTMEGPAGTPQLVKANPEPYKIKPENPGGMQVENQDKLVYERVAKGDAPPRVENLLPGPEQPKAPPRPSPAAPSEPPTAAEKPAAAPAKPIETTAKPEPAPAAKSETAAEAAKPAEPAKPAQDDLAALVAAATGGREAATGPIDTKPAAAPPADEAQVAAAAPIAKPEAATAPSAAPAPAPAPAPVPAAAPAPGAFQIQLASARSEQGAMAEWNRISAKNKEALAGLTPNVARVDLGEKGVFFRLRAGPLADKAAADSLCTTLGAQNVGCIVVRP